MIRGPADPQGLRLLEDLIFPGGFIVRMQQDVRMRSINPGRRVVFGSSMMCVALGTLTSSAGPAAKIFSPLTRITQPSCG